MRPRLITETEVEAQACLRRGPAGHWTLTTPKQLLVLDPEFEVAVGVDLPYPSAGSHGVAPDLGCVALALEDRVALLDARGRALWEAPHRPWADGEAGSARIRPDGTVWATAPGADGRDRWQVLDAATGARLATLVLDAHGAGGEAVAPAGDTAAPALALSLTLPVGSDGPGFQLYWGWSGPAGPTVQRVPGTRQALADIRPGADRYLTMAADHSALSLHSADGGVLATCRAADALDGDDCFDFGATFVTPQVVIARPLLGEHHLLLDATSLSVLDLVSYPVGMGHDMVASAADGSWVTTDWLDGYARLWSA